MAMENSHTQAEKTFGVKMDALMGMQPSYNIAQTRKIEERIDVKRFRPSI